MLNTWKLQSIFSALTSAIWAGTVLIYALVGIAPSPLVSIAAIIAIGISAVQVVFWATR